MNAVVDHARIVMARLMLDLGMADTLTSHVDVLMRYDIDTMHALGVALDLEDLRTEYEELQAMRDNWNENQPREEPRKTYARDLARAYMAKME